jgi:hypothetical protein
MKVELPEQLIDGAILRDKEYAWELSTFPIALRNAPELGYACLGGQFWFLSRTGSLYEPFWLEANSTDRATGEPWLEYAQRSCTEVLAGFNALLENANYVEEAKKFGTFSNSLSMDEFKAEFRVLFNAYFVTEEDLFSLLGC